MWDNQREMNVLARDMDKNPKLAGVGQEPVTVSQMATNAKQ